MIEPPRYSTTSETLRTIALGIAAPALLSALAIGIGVPTGAGWLTGLGIALCWPVIGYVVVAHVLRVQLERHLEPGLGLLPLLETRGDPGGQDRETSQ